MNPDIIFQDLQCTESLIFNKQEEKCQEKAVIPIIAMTANAFEEDRRNAFKAGMNGHIAKPIHVEELFSLLAEMIK